MPVYAKPQLCWYLFKCVSVDDECIRVGSTFLVFCRFTPVLWLGVWLNPLNKSVFSISCLAAQITGSVRRHQHGGDAAMRSASLVLGMAFDSRTS